MTNLLSPWARKVDRVVGPVTTVGNTLRTIIGRQSYARTIQAVSYIPQATQNGADTNSRTLTLYNRGTDGLGTTVVAQLALTSGVNLTDNVAKVITLSATPANLEIPANAVLEWESLAVGTGIADPGGLVEIQFARADT